MCCAQTPGADIAGDLHIAAEGTVPFRACDDMHKKQNAEPGGRLVAHPPVSSLRTAPFLSPIASGRRLPCGPPFRRGHKDAFGRIKAWRLIGADHGHEHTLAALPSGLADPPFQTHTLVEVECRQVATMIRRSPANRMPKPTSAYAGFRAVLPEITIACQEHDFKRPGARLKASIAQARCCNVVCSRERENTPRSNKRDSTWTIYERPIGSEQEDHSRLACPRT